MYGYDSKEADAIKILKGFHTIAVVGCSRTVGKPSHDVPEYLQNEGYKIIPVNPYAEEILGEKAYKSLEETKGLGVEVVDVFRPSSEALDIAKQAVDIAAKVLWLQEGIFSTDAESYAVSHGLMFIENRCMMKEHTRLKLEGKI
ncbi:MAG: CoA-binding protein [Candidatus Micrarchaeia archaeon]